MVEFMLYLQHLVTMTINKVEAQADIRQVVAVPSASWNAATLRRAHSEDTRDWIAPRMEEHCKHQLLGPAGIPHYEKQHTRVPLRIH
jgi:hypothetical protein